MMIKFVGQVPDLPIENLAAARPCESRQAGNLPHGEQYHV